MFQVEWIQSALDELTRLWVAANSSQRQAITHAAHEIDQRLGADPLAEGESRSGDRRILFVAPLGITYRLESDGVTVTVLHVWQFRTHS